MEYFLGRLQFRVSIKTDDGEIASEVVDTTQLIKAPNRVLAERRLIESFKADCRGAVRAVLLSHRVHETLMSPQSTGEHIICSAIWHHDGIEHVHQPINIKTGIVVCGHRHHNCINVMAQMGIDGKSVGFGTQGFLTNTNRFVDREEAARIAFTAGQIEEIIKELDSSHLY